MKKEFLFVCLFALLFIPGFAKEHTPIAKKYYCNAHQIELTDSAIVLHLAEKSYELDALLADQGGIYYTDDMLRCTYCRRPIRPNNICECPQPNL
jgi:hypothetical protein